MSFIKQSFKHIISKNYRSLLFSTSSIKASNESFEEAVIPKYVRKENETLETKKARLLYQSRKRGMLENGLLLGTFADKYLMGMDQIQIDLYDKLINEPSNDWDIFYWSTGVKETPAEFDNEIMDLLKKHVSNPDRESRIRQPDLKPML